MAENKFETIGKVTLDLARYPGEDYYCDGAVEDELLAIVKEHAQEDYAQIMEASASWPVLYHLSPLRANIIDWLPMAEGCKVLEIGSGCGAITGRLSEKAGQVTSVDLSKKRSLINAYRNRERENICIKVGNFQEIEPDLDTDYDMIFLIGVFEYAKGYIGKEAPYTEFLNTVMKHCREGGQVVVAIENRLGLKYFAGCREDHLGDFFSGIEDYPEGGAVRTFTRPGLEKIFSACGIRDYHFYYPYPDYKFASAVYSDERLPKVGELSSNLRNFDRSRLLLFDEKNAFDSILRDGEFPLFSNSYLAVIGPKPEIIYSKFSNDRDRRYAVRTDMICLDGRLEVRKVPCGEEAAGHVGRMARAGEALTKRFEGSGLVVCPCHMEGDIAVFPFLEGMTLEEKLDECLDRNDMEGFRKLFADYYGFVSYHADAGVTDHDLIFPNILVSPVGGWQVIDYEWTYFEAGGWGGPADGAGTLMMTPEGIAKRALFCYRLGSEKRKGIDAKGLAEEFGLGDWDEEALWEEETAFQNMVTGSRKSLSQMRDLIHNEVLPLTDAVRIYEQKKQKQKVQIYYDRGDGFSEADSEFVMPLPGALEGSKSPAGRSPMGERAFTSDDGGGLYSVKAELADGLRQVRLDPAMEPVMVSLLAADIRDSGGTVREYPLKKILCNGRSVAENTYVFTDNDPNMVFPALDAAGGRELTVTYSMVRIPMEMAGKFAGRAKKKWFG